MRQIAFYSVRFFYYCFSLIQAKFGGTLQAEIDEAVAAAGGQLPDYNVIQSGMPYLEGIKHDRPM